MKNVAVVLLAFLVTATSFADTGMTNQPSSDSLYKRGLNPRPANRHDFTNPIEKWIHNLVDIVTLDVINFYGLGNQYDTPLKRKVFFGSDAYRKKLQELEALKAKVLATEFYISLRKKKFEISTSMQNKENFQSAYNLDKKLFEMYLFERTVTVSAFGIETSNPENRIPQETFLLPSPEYGVVLKMPLEIKRIQAQIFGAERLILLPIHSFPIDEVTALKIETQSRVRIYFKIIGVKKYDVFKSDTGLGQKPIYCFFTTNNRIQIVSGDNRVLYKKQY